MSKNNSLSKLTFIYAVGNLSSKVLSFVLIFAMTYFLNKTELGEYDLILTTLFFIVPCVSLQIDSAALRWLLDDSSEANQKIVYGNSQYLLLVNTGIYTILFWGFSYFYPIKWAGYIYALSVLQIIFPFQQQGIRGLGKNVLYTVSGISYSLLYAGITMGALYFFKANVEGVLIGNIVAQLIAVLLLFIKNKYYLHLSLKPVNKPVLIDMLKYSLPLLPNSLSWWLIVSANRFIILYFLGVEANGIFAISFKYPSIIFAISGIFNLAWQEKAIQTFKNADKGEYYTNILDKYVRFIFTTVIVLAASSKLMMKHMVSASFFEAWKYTPILFLAVAIQSLVAFYGVGYLSSKQTKGAFISSLAGGLLTIVLSIGIIKFLGLYGVCISIFLGSLLMLVIRVKQAGSYFTIKFPLKLVLELSFFFAVASSFNFMPGTLYTMAGVAISVLVFLFYNRAFIDKIKLKLNWK